MHLAEIQFAYLSVWMSGAIDQGIEAEFLHSLSKGDMKKIQLDCSNFPHSVFEQLPVSLPASLKELQLTLGEGGDSSMRTFCSSVSDVTLASLDVSNNNLHDAAAQAIADAISSHKLKITRKLNLSDNLLGMDGVGSIARCIGGGSLRSLEVIILAGVATPCIVGSRSPPAETIEHSCLQPFFDAISTTQLPNLTTLDISDNSLGSRQTLTTCSIDKMRVLTGACGACAFVDAASDGQLRQLSKLLIRQNNIFDVGTTHLARGIGAFPNLTAIDLSSNGIDEGLVPLVAALVTLPNFSELNLALNEIQDAAATVLVDALTSNQLPSLHVLGLDQNGLSPEMEAESSVAEIQCKYVGPDVEACCTTQHKQYLRTPAGRMTDGSKQPVLSVPPNQLHPVQGPKPNELRPDSVWQRETHALGQFDTEVTSSAWHLIADDNDSLIADDKALNEQLELYSAREKRFGSGTMRMSREKCLVRQRDLALAIEARGSVKPRDAAEYYERIRDIVLQLFHDRT